MKESLKFLDYRDLIELLVYLETEIIKARDDWNLEDLEDLEIQRQDVINAIEHLRESEPLDVD